jgi:hypothetical protein
MDILLTIAHLLADGTLARTMALSLCGAMRH